MFARRFSYLVFAAAGTIVLSFLSSNVRAQEIGDLNSSRGSVTTNASETSAPISQPFLRFRTTAQASCDGENSPCPDTSCVGGHTCGCMSFSNLPINLPQPIGPVPFKLSTEISLDFTLATVTGVGSCFVAYGVGTATRISNGDTVGLNFDGQYCAGANSTSTVSGAWHVNGGTGNLVNASGAGDYTEGVSALIGVHTCVLTTDGAFRKAP